MKKIELHLHLDGSLEPSFASKLLKRDVSKEMIGSDCESLTEYLEKFQLPIELLQEEKTIEEFSYLLAKELERDEVIYAEVRFCPLFHLKKISIDKVIASILAGFKKVPSVKINLIFCMMRNFSFEDNKKIIDFTEAYLHHGICGIDLAGDEANYPTKDFEKLFAIIKKKNIPFTIHAGEASGSDSVNAAIAFGAKRIGHGIHSIDSKKTIQQLLDKQIVLEICPTSNLNTKCVQEISLHPIKKLVDLGVKVTINTDNRTVSDTNLRKEYQLLRETFHFSEEDFLRFNLNAIDASFLTEEEKEVLKEKLLHN